MSVKNLNMILKTAATLHNQEKFYVEVLARKAKQAVEINPYDSTIIAMCNFLTKKASNDMYISRGELSNAYQKLYSRNTKFASMFAEELGLKESKPSVSTYRNENEGNDLLANAVDQTLVSALSSGLKNGDQAGYNKDLGVKASKVCLQELSKFAMPKNVNAVAGQNDLLICRATYETPKGSSSVLVPVEIRDNQPLLPTVFVSQVGFEDLSKAALENHLISTAGKNLYIDVNKLLTVLASVKKPKMSDVEVAVAKMKLASGSTTSDLTDGIVNQNIDAINPDVVIERHADADLFAEKLSSSSGEAEFVFGKINVNAAKKMINDKLANCGFSKIKLAINNIDKSNIYFNVALDNAGFKVPVKMANGPEMPKFVLASGSMYEFSTNGLTNLVKNVAGNDVVASVSSLSECRPSDLVEQVRIAMTEGHVEVAEDAINVLLQNGHTTEHKQAVAYLIDGLNGKLEKAAECKCTMQRKVAQSKYLVCGHTNLPLHKVYQDQYGQCLPLYRKGMPEQGVNKVHYE